jgi:hypothetical protein
MYEQETKDVHMHLCKGGRQLTFIGIYNAQLSV